MQNIPVLAFFISAVFCAIFAGSFVAVSFFLFAILREFKARMIEGLTVRIARTPKLDP